MNIGDKVLVLIGDSNKEPHFVEGMEVFVNKEATITDYYIDDLSIDNRVDYLLDIDNAKFIWHEDWLELLC